MDREGRWVTVPGVTKRQTEMSDQHLHKSDLKTDCRLKCKIIKISEKNI